jgi:hypothetical protein
MRVNSAVACCQLQKSSGKFDIIIHDPAQDLADYERPLSQTCCSPSRQQNGHVKMTMTAGVKDLGRLLDAVKHGQPKRLISQYLDLRQRRFQDFRLWPSTIPPACNNKAQSVLTKQSNIPADDNLS